MTIEKYEKLNAADKEIAEEAAREIAWDWISDHYDDEDINTCEEMQDEIWMDFLKDLD